MRPVPLALLLAFSPLTAQAVAIDGRIDHGEWDDARHIEDFRTVQPLNRAPAGLATEAWLKATPEGLAIAFRSVQPASVTPTRQRFQRDQAGSVDRVNLYIDYNGDGRTGYNFMVTRGGDLGDSTIANENQFNPDWDAQFEHAVAETDAGWDAELLIPWHTATMAAAKGDTRKLKLSVDRVVGSTGERYAWPAITWSEPRFLSALAEVEVPSYSQSLLAVTPYVVAVQDMVHQRADFDAGADVFWKPSGQFQLSATLNPDFGQVESDQLVVNFSSIETFFSDKRPFFTENQGLFDVNFGSIGGANRLLYTRRVGATTDDGSGAGEVGAAVKLNGSAGAFNYGVFAADEHDPVGRDFYALRGTWDHDGFGLGAMLTEVERPYLDRTARSLAFDPRWKPNDTLDLRVTVVGSEIDQAGQRSRDSGGQLLLNHDLGGGWQQQLFVLHSGRDLQLNDFGYLDRNDFNYLRYERSRRIADLPETSPWASHQWRYAASTRRNDRGQRLWDTVAMNEYSERRDGGNRFWELAATGPVNDDLLTFGNGMVRLPYRFYAFAERFWARRGDSRFEWYGNLRYAKEGLRGFGHGSKQAHLDFAWVPVDAVRWYAGLEWVVNDDWVLWQHDQVVDFDAQQTFLFAGVNWRVSPKQELRVKLESIGLRGETRSAWRVGAGGSLLASSEPAEDFRLQSLGFQVRYRYELAPLSDLYIAYVRGGSLFDEGEGFGGAFGQLGNAFELRDSEQLLIKLSYRFDR